MEQVLFVRRECFSLLTPVHSASALERNTSNPHKWLHRSGAALSSPVLALVTLVLFSKECSCLMPVAFVLDVSLWWVFYRGGNKAAKNKVWTRSKAETLMETLLFLQEKFFWFLNLVSRRDSGLVEVVVAFLLIHPNESRKMILVNVILASRSDWIWDLLNSTVVIIPCGCP